MSKILVVKSEVANKAWMLSMPEPLKANQKVVVHNNQDDVMYGFVRVKHGKGCVSVWSKDHFKQLGE